MQFKISKTIALVVATAFTVGCHQTNEQTTEQNLSTNSGTGDHAAWWCTEHGIPEEVCSMCSAKAAADFKKKGDWCKEHDRAASQCFKCNQDLQAAFAAQYEAKFGTQPPPIEN